MLRSPSIAKLGGDAAGRGVGEDRDVGEPRAIQPRQRRRYLGHLHQRERAFHHARAAGAGNDDDGLTAVEGHFDGSRQLLAGHHAHAAADEAVFHRGNHHIQAVEPARRHDDRVVETGGLDGLLEALAIGLGIGEAAADRWSGGREKCSWYLPPSKSAVSRSVAFSRKWCAHFGQTFKLPSRSFL
jgi:hypothetical protein